jgi:hypothetical protein
MWTGGDMKSWTFLQKMNLGLGVVFLAHAIGGLIVNPDFAVGDNATAEDFLWMDWNGWHALSGIFLWATALAVAPRADLSRLFAWLIIGTNLPVVIWMLFDTVPFGLFSLPTTRDLVFHAAIVLAYALALLATRKRAVVHTS